MVSISVCMIVKNEEANLDSAISSLEGIYDELIIVDTGSTDKTKEIAKRYTDKIYDFEWVDDFSKARNFAFSKATMDYIYSADADEFIDDDNRQKLKELKGILDEEVEIVQMVYYEKTFSTVLNSDKELRPKLYKRKRNFTWIDPVHETIRTLPVVFDSDIIIEHRPKDLHAKRDISLIAKAYKKEGALSKKLWDMYTKECYKWADKEDLEVALDISEQMLSHEMTDFDTYISLSVICARASRVLNDENRFLKYSSRVIASCACSEICCEMGDYFFEKKDYKEASMWFEYALNNCESIMDSASGNEYPKDMLNRIEEISV